MYASHIEHIELCSNEHLNTLVGLIEALPEFDSRHDVDAMVSRLQSQPHLALLSFVEGELAGFKLGYGLDDTTFYSWLGGVLPDFRKLGLAKAMLQAQETWASSKGYQTIEVKTQNRYGAMLTMLVTNGYQVVALETKEQVQDHKMTLRKAI